MTDILTKIKNSKLYKLTLFLVEKSMQTKIKKYNKKYLLTIIKILKNLINSFRKNKKAKINSLYSILTTGIINEKGKKSYGKKTKKKHYTFIIIWPLSLFFLN